VQAKDLRRSTAYEILDAKGNDGRISESNGEQAPPGGAVTVTAVFTAPPAEVTELTAFIDGSCRWPWRCRPRGRRWSTTRC